MRLRTWISIAFFAVCLGAQAQWVNQPMAGAPRTPDGKIDPTGPVPRVNGKPDLSGIWQAEAEPRGPGLYGLGESPNSKYFRNLLSDFKPTEEPLTPYGAEVLRRNRQPGAFNPTLNCLPDGTPHADLLPEPFKIIQTPGELIMLYEVETTFRQVFTDGRKQLTDPSPSWMGYSVGKWEGDTLVVDTVGFNNETWLDAAGHMHGEKLHVIEKFSRPDSDTLRLEATIDDPDYYTKPWAVVTTSTWAAGQELLEYICQENNRDIQHLVGK